MNVTLFEKIFEWIKYLSFGILAWGRKVTFFAAENIGGFRA
jgi:hypothetical protein